MAQSPLHTVRLLLVPLRIRERSTQHAADLLREMQLIVGGQVTGVSLHVPRRLLEVGEQLDRLYAPQIAAAAASYEAASSRGESSVAETVYELPTQAGAFALQVAQILIEVDTFCREGRHLLTMPATPVVAGYRQWSLGEVARQIDGHAATSWPDYARANGLVTPLRAVE